MIKSVTTAINDVHRNKISTYGDPRFYPRNGFPLVPAIQLSAAYSFDSAEALIHYHENKYEGQRYCRDSNELVMQLERYFGALFPGCQALMFNSGMGALAAAVDILMPANGVVFLTRESYRKTSGYATRMAAIRNCKVMRFTTIEHIEAVARAGSPVLVVLETPTNPHLHLHDFEEYLELKHRYGVKIIADISLAGLCNIDFDFSEYDAANFSVTKYVGGHNDILGGVVLAGKKPVYDELWSLRSERGGLMDPLSAYLLLRSLRTYDMRVTKQVSNAATVLDHLLSKSRVLNIFHPSINKGPEERVFRKYYQHGGSMISFVVDMDVRPLLDKLGQMHSVKMAPSFGAVDTLIEVPWVMSHYGKTEKELTDMGLEPNLVRVSCGCEPMSDLQHDFDFLLDAE